MRTKFVFTLAVCLLAALISQPVHAQSQVPYATSNSAPGAVVFNGTMYLFYVLGGQPTGGYLHYQTSDGTTWSTRVTVPQAAFFSIASNSAPRAAVFNNRLYVFYTCGDTKIRYWSMDASGNWDPNAGVVTGASANFSPGVAAFNGKLYAAWRATGFNESIFYASMDTAGTWTSTARLAVGETSRGPSLASFVAANGVEYIYGVWKDRQCIDCAEKMWYSRMSPGTGWSSGAHLDSGDWPMTARDPFITAANGGLSVVYTGGYNAGLLYKNLTSSLAWQNEVLVDASAPNSIVTAAYINGHLHAFYFSNTYIYEEVLY
jgi:hypothetical protein